jgi:hypothetical protein
MIQNRFVLVVKKTVEVPPTLAQTKGGGVEVSPKVTHTLGKQ